jgi:hypothetical protein
MGCKNDPKLTSLAPAKTLILSRGSVDRGSRLSFAGGSGFGCDMKSHDGCACRRSGWTGQEEPLPRWPFVCLEGQGFGSRLDSSPHVSVFMTSWLTSAEDVAEGPMSCMTCLVHPLKVSWDPHEVCRAHLENCRNKGNFLFLFFFFFVVLGFELGVYTVSHSTSPFV